MIMYWALDLQIQLIRAGTLVRLCCVHMLRSRVIHYIFYASQRMINLAILIMPPCGREDHRNSATLSLVNTTEVSSENQ